MALDVPNTLLGLRRSRCRVGKLKAILTHYGITGLSRGTKNTLISGIPLLLECYGHTVDDWHKALQTYSEMSQHFPAFTRRQLDMTLHYLLNSWGPERLGNRRNGHIELANYTIRQRNSPISGSQCPFPFSSVNSSQPAQGQHSVIQNDNSAPRMSFAPTVRDAQSLDPADSIWSPIDAILSVRSIESQSPISQATPLPTPPPPPAECIACFERLTENHHSVSKISEVYAHEVNLCQICLSQSIATQFTTKMWNHIDCPECGSRLNADDINRHADRETFDR